VLAGVGRCRRVGGGIHPLILGVHVTGAGWPWPRMAVTNLHQLSRSFVLRAKGWRAKAMRAGVHASHAVSTRS
jgi:hypothetical protein